jgi:hypothetical protein
VSNGGHKGEILSCSVAVLFVVGSEGLDARNVSVHYYVQKKYIYCICRGS